MRPTFIFFALPLLSIGGTVTAQAAETTGAVAAKPLSRDPVYDGAADPVVVWNSHNKRWWMF